MTALARLLAAGDRLRDALTAKLGDKAPPVHVERHTYRVAVYMDAAGADRVTELVAGARARVPNTGAMKLPPRDTAFGRLRRPRLDADDELRRLHGEGKTNAEIGRLLGVAGVTVGNHMRRLGLAANGASAPKGPPPLRRPASPVAVELDDTTSYVDPIDDYIGREP